MHDYGFTAAVLNSRQSRTPAGNDDWIRFTADALEHLKERDAGVVTSAGMNTYEFVLWYAGILGMKQLVVLNQTDVRRLDRRAEDFLAEFELDASKIKFTASNSVSRTARDRTVMELADVLYPVSVRPGGNIDRALASSGKEIRDDFRTNYEPPAASVPDYRRLCSSGRFEKWDYLTHWTRTAYGPFPNETRADYYRTVLESRTRYLHDALGAIRNMLYAKTIYATNLTIRGGTPVVSFTGSGPVESLPFMHWNNARVRMNFEPYGIAIRRKAAEHAGIRPVIYGGTGDYDKLAGADKPFYQNRGLKGEWTVENEWRHEGDLRLDAFGTDDVAVIVVSRKEAEILAKRDYPYRIVVLEDGG